MTTLIPFLAAIVAAILGLAGGFGPELISQNLNIVIASGIFVAGMATLWAGMNIVFGLLK